MNGLPLIVGISGASGAVYGLELLRACRAMGLETHAIISRAARRTIELETDTSPEQAEALATVCHGPDDIAAAPASGSFRTRGMIVAPCSMKTLSAIANSFGHNLLTRAADVQLKERRPLVLMVRETPLHQGHLELMARCASLGAIILPPVPAFYHRPKEIIDLVRQSVGKALDMVGVEHDLFERWKGPDH